MNESYFHRGTSKVFVTPSCTQVKLNVPELAVINQSASFLYETGTLYPMLGFFFTNIFRKNDLEKLNNIFPH